MAMKRGGNFETRQLQMSRYDLLQTNLMVNLFHDGWELLYILPPLPKSTPPAYVSITSQNTTTYLDIGTGQFNYFIPSTNTTTDEGYFDIGLIRYTEIESCPRCSHPYENPNRLDREE
jgi:hypothetical protein